MSPTRRPRANAIQGAAISGLRAAPSGAFSAVILLLCIVPAWADPLALRVTRAEVAYDQRNSEPVVTMVFDEASRRPFADFTARNVGKVMELRVDGRAVSLNRLVRHTTASLLEP